MESKYSIEQEKEIPFYSIVTEPRVSQYEEELQPDITTVILSNQSIRELFEIKNGRKTINKYQELSVECPYISFH